MGNMAERPVKIPAIDEQRMLHSLYVGSQENVPGDQRLRSEKLELTREEETRRMAALMVKILTGNEAEKNKARTDLAEGFRAIAPPEIGRPNSTERRVPESVNDIYEESKRLDGIIRAKLGRNEQIPRGLQDSYDRCEMVMSCMDEAATLTAQALMNAPDGTPMRAVMETAILDTSNIGPRGIEELLSGQPGGGVLVGVGNRVAENTITDRELIGAVTLMRAMVDVYGSPNGTDLSPQAAEKLGNTIRDAYSRGTFPSGRVADQAAIVEDYYAYLCDRAGLTEIHSAQQAGVAPPVEGGRPPHRGAYDGKQYGEAEGFDRTGSLTVPDKAVEAAARIENERQAKEWMVQTLVQMSENPLFFANWWQQSSSFCDGLISMATRGLNYGPFSSELADFKSFTYANLSVLGMRVVDQNADANTENLGQFSAPKNMANELHWDDGGKKYELLRKDPAVSALLDGIFADAFSPTDGWKVVQAFSEKGAFYKMENAYIRDLLANNAVQQKLRQNGVDMENQTPQAMDALIARGRVAMAMFEVDWLPEWIRWSNVTKWEYEADKMKPPAERQNPPPRDVPWLHSAFKHMGEDPALNYPDGPNGKIRSGVPLSLQYTYDGQLEADVPGSDRTVKLWENHPRVLRMWEVIVGAKGTYRHRPELLWQMQRTLEPFIDRRLTDPATGRWKRASEMNILDVFSSKYQKVISEITGGPQGLEMDNITTMDKIVPLAANFWGASVNGDPAFGKFLEDLFYLKAETMFHPGYRSQAQATLAKIEGLDTMSGEKEKKIALEGLIGPNGSWAHGWVAEVKRDYGIDLLEVDPATGVAKYPLFMDTFARVFMDTPDVREARKTYEQARRALTRKTVSAAAGGAYNVVNTVLGSGGGAKKRR